MSDFEVVPSGTVRAIADKLDYLYGVNGIDSRAYDVLRGLLPEALTPPNASCGRCDGRGTIGIREICPRCGGAGKSNPPASRATLRQLSGSAKAARSVYCVDGESVTVADVAQRLGVSETTASDRIRREQAKPGAVSWDGLRLVGARA